MTPKKITAEHDPEIELWLPKNDCLNPEISIVIPAMNEKITIGEFVDWCKEGLAKANIEGEILIVDSSTDETPEIAIAHGARVLKAPKRGLGRAYIDSIPFIRSQYVLMGDADLTYDFREFTSFVEKFKEGYEYIMGSRFHGYIEPGAMPPLHQYFGTPGTTWVLNTIYSSNFSDIHCGMRGITLDALKRMDLQSQSWEYASEMVLKSVHMKLHTTEVPIRFLKDREGRESHMKREGFLGPWKAAWINLKAMFINGSEFFLFKPGIILLLLGLALVIPLTWGPVTFGKITFSSFWMVLGVILSILGLQFFYMGILSKVIFDYSGSISRFWQMVFTYNRSMVVSIVLFFSGLVMAWNFAQVYIDSNYLLLKGAPLAAYTGITGLLMMVAAFMNFTFTLLLYAIVTIKKPPAEANPPVGVGNEDNWEDHWEAFSLASEKSPGQIYRQNLIRWLLRQATEGSSKRVIDFGSGHGDTLVQMNKAFPQLKLLGMELSQTGIDFAKKKVPKADFVQFDLVNTTEPLPAYKEWAEVGVCSEVLEHLDEPEKMLVNMKHYLSPTAKVIFTVPGGPRSYFDKHIGHRKHYTCEELCGLLESSGYRIEQAYAAGFPFFNLYRLVMVARGEKLVEEVKRSTGSATSSRLADVVMWAFRKLFFFNFRDSLWGWQIVVVASKNPTQSG